MKCNYFNNILLIYSILFFSFFNMFIFRHEINAQEKNLEVITQKGYKLIDSGQVDAGIKLLVEAADKDYSEAQLYLGRLYSFSKLIPIDLPKSIMWLTKASNQGNSDAQLLLALMYAEGKGVPINDVESVKLLKKSAKNGNKDAKDWLRIYESEIKVKVQKKLKLKGYYTGKIDGKWGKKSRLALSMFLKDKNINSNGDINNIALKTLGISQSILSNKFQDYLEKGIKLIKSGKIDEGINLVKKAAENNYSDAQLCLGLLYSIGDNVPKDLEKSIMWLSKSSKLGNSVAQYQLALNYFNGEGVPVNTSEALKLLRKSANNGNKKAKDLLLSYERSKENETKRKDFPTYEQIESLLLKTNNKVENKENTKVGFLKLDSGDIGIGYMKSPNGYDYNMILLKEGIYMTHCILLGETVGSDSEVVVKKVNQFIYNESSNKKVIDLRHDTPTKLELREIMSYHKSEAIGLEID